MLELLGNRLRPTRFAGMSGEMRVMLDMPSTRLFGNSDGQLVAGGVPYEIRSDRNRLWLIDDSGGQRGYAELLGLKTHVTVAQMEFELKKFKLDDAVMRVVYDGRAVGAITGTGKGKRKLIVDVDMLQDASGLAFLAVAAIAGWRDFMSTMAIAAEGQARREVGYVPTPGSDAGAGADWGNNREGTASGGGGFWDGFGGGDGGGGGGDGGG